MSRQSGIIACAVTLKSNAKSGWSFPRSSTPATAFPRVSQLTSVARVNNAELGATLVKGNPQIGALLRRIHKGKLPQTKLASLETKSESVYKSGQDLIFFRLKSCLKTRREKGTRTRVEWNAPQCDNSRVIEFSVEEVRVRPEELVERSAEVQSRPKRNKSRRKAESHDFGRKKDSATETRPRKKNYSSKKDKLRKEIAKYFYQSDLGLPGKENVFNGQKRVKNVSKVPFKKANLLQEKAKNQIIREKFFYKKKLTQKR